MGRLYLPYMAGLGFGLRVSIKASVRARFCHFSIMVSRVIRVRIDVKARVGF